MSPQVVLARESLLTPRAHMISCPTMLKTIHVTFPVTGGGEGFGAICVQTWVGALMSFLVSAGAVLAWVVMKG
jgi:hypothetical protein